MTTDVTTSRARRSRTLLITALGLGVVLALGLWDVRREDVLALRQLMQEHHVLAATLATSLEPLANEIANRPVSTDARAVEPGNAGFRGAVKRIEQNSGFVVLLSYAAREEFLTPDGRWVPIPELAAAIAQKRVGVTLSRDVAAKLRLPRRTAVAGIARAPDGLRGQIRGLVVVASAKAERDRSLRDQWRTVLVVLLASILIVGAGVGALRAQRRDLELERQRAVHQMERARDAELARANRMATIAALASGIAHEISTPLGVITGRIEQLQAVLRGQERHDRAVATIVAQINRIDQVMRGFLAFARGEAPILTQRSANEIAASAVKLVQYRFASAKVALEFCPCADAELQIACEPSLFEQALVDILINALEASVPGQKVALSVHYDQSSVAFVVLDEGTGISDSIVARATEPFFTTKAGKGGSGLGLTIAKEILVHHQGDIEFELRNGAEGHSQPGTRVVVKLPRTEERSSAISI